MNENRLETATFPTTAQHFSGFDWLAEHVAPALGELMPGELVMILLDLERARAVAIVLPADPANGAPRAVQLAGIPLVVTMDAAGRLVQPWAGLERASLGAMPFAHIDGRSWSVAAIDLPDEVDPATLARAWGRLQAAQNESPARSPDDL